MLELLNKINNTTKHFFFSPLSWTKYESTTFILSMLFSGLNPLLALIVSYYVGVLTGGAGRIIRRILKTK